jgi:hypothetical protein
MRVVVSFLIPISLATGPVSTARFSVDGVRSVPSTTLATIQPRNGAPTYSCDMSSLRIPNRTFEWDVDLDVPAVNVAP